MVTHAVDPVYRSYYTKSDPIVRYMVSRLALSSKMSVLEPCAGDGVFVNALIKNCTDLQIDVFDLNPDAIAALGAVYGNNPNVRITHGDTLTDPDLAIKANLGGGFDRVIANPPYGAWQTPEKRSSLKRLYNGMYAKETYTLFLYFCTELLKESGKLVFIIPDTFLNLHRHAYLRDYLLTNTKIEEILLIPSTFFPGVSFGYANLSIITLQKLSNRGECLNNRVRIVKGFKSVLELGSPEATPSVVTMSQQEIHEAADHALLLSDIPSAITLIRERHESVGDIASCVTGFYSGNDAKHLRRRPGMGGRAAKYGSVTEDKLYSAAESGVPPLTGIAGPQCFIPIVKGGNTRFIKPTDWYMDWSIEAVQEYRTDKKARFQNSDYYFGFGIGVPMVSSTFITAAMLEGRLFDQSIVGIFPKDTALTGYLLALFNSPTCNRLIRTINPSANNSANYIKKIPFIRPESRVQGDIEMLVDHILSSLKAGRVAEKDLAERLNALVAAVYGF